MREKDSKLLEDIAKVCNDRGVFIIDDLVYRDISFKEDNLAEPIATIPSYFRNTISLFGLSKCYGMASLRSRFADEIIIRELVNEIFQTMDSAPVIVGQALCGAFNTSLERNKIYEEYFKELREIYFYKYNLIVALVDGINLVDNKYKEIIKNKIKEKIKENDLIEKCSNVLPYVTFSKNLVPEAGFFAILNFTKIKGMKYKGSIINTERDLLNFFYKTNRIRFLVGQSIPWPNKDELIGRVSFALNDDLMIEALMKMHKSLEKLTSKDEYIIRKNILEDQEQMAHIKVDGWRNAYNNIVSAKYLNQLDYKSQTERYISSFEEYKDLVLVAIKEDEVLGYSCFDIKNNEKYDLELVSLYIKPSYLKKELDLHYLKKLPNYYMNKIIRA